MLFLSSLVIILWMLLFRIKFYTQEIVFFRQDLLYRMRRSCLLPPSTAETSDPFEHVSSFSSLHLQACFTKHPTCILMYPLFLLQLVATIVHQSHLCPLPLNVQPIIWNYDHCLQLYPSPQTVQTYTSKCNLFSTVLTSFREARLFFKKNSFRHWQWTGQFGCFKSRMDNTFFFSADCARGSKWAKGI